MRSVLNTCLRSRGRCGLGACVVIICLSTGCTPELIRNLTQEVTGNVILQFVNNTDFRAVFSFGTYDAFDRDPPGPATLQQLRIETGTTSNGVTVTCRRNVAIGTEEFVQRIVDVNADATPNFDPEAFDTVVRFSSAPQDSQASGLPTAGTADGVTLLLGVDYTCDDLILFTFSADPAAPGGFRIDFSVIPDSTSR